MSEPSVRGAITVIKRDAAGQEVWRYSGRLLRQDEHSLVLEARFDKDDVLFKRNAARQRRSLCRDVLHGSLV